MKATSALGNLKSKNDISEAELNAVLDRVSDALSDVQEVIDFMKSLSATLPRYLKEVAPETNSLVAAMNSATVSITEIVEIKSGPIKSSSSGASVTITEQHKINLGINNSTIALKNTLSTIDSLLSQVEMKLR